MITDNFFLSVVFQKLFAYIIYANYYYFSSMLKFCAGKYNCTIFHLDLFPYYFYIEVYNI